MNETIEILIEKETKRSMRNDSSIFLCFYGFRSISVFWACSMIFLFKTTNSLAQGQSMFSTDFPLCILLFCHPFPLFLNFVRAFYFSICYEEASKETCRSVGSTGSFVCVRVFFSVHILVVVLVFHREKKKPNKHR